MVIYNFNGYKQLKQALSGYKRQYTVGLERMFLIWYCSSKSFVENSKFKTTVFGICLRLLEVYKNENTLDKILGYFIWFEGVYTG